MAISIHETEFIIVMDMRAIACSLHTSFDFKTNYQHCNFLIQVLKPPPVTIAQFLSHKRNAEWKSGISV